MKLSIVLIAVLCITCELCIWALDCCMSLLVVRSQCAETMEA